MHGSRRPPAARLPLGLVFVLAAAMAVGGCAATVPPAGGGGGSGAGGARPESLTGRTFLSEQVTEGGEPRPLVEGTRIEIGFSDDGRLRATAGCNTLSGAVEVQARRIVVGELASTRIGCPPERHDQDRWLAGVLTADPVYELRGTRLVLESGDTAIRLVDRTAGSPNRPLVGTEWRLESLVDGEAVSSLPPGTGATLLFGDGSLSLQVVDCNRGTADVVIARLAVEVGVLSMTERACAPDPSAVELAVVGVLQGIVGYRIDGDVLTLRHPSGIGLVLRAIA
jgi:heat shock protein HslJ